MLIFLFLPNLGMGASNADAPAPPAPAPARRGKGRRREPPPLIRFVIELGEDKHYFRTESEARSFLERRARTIYRRAKAVSRKSHKIELPGKAERIPLRAPSPIPRFVAEGSESVRLLTQQINARIDAILANPEREADEDDEDLERLLNEIA